MRGGKRQGAGRPKGQGKYQEPTKVIRIPISLEQKVKSFIETDTHEVPLFSTHVQAGFPSPADDHIDQKLNIHTLLIKHPAATLFVKVAGDSMIDAHIFEGDLLVVDRSLNAKPNDIVIAVLNGELTVKRLIKKQQKFFLKPENPAYPLIELTRDNDSLIWGVVTSVIRQFI
tara:strand:+ start:8338 stop:8853 length:516 start_codon:yes stop_codon:yes gene_type:complete